MDTIANNKGRSGSTDQAAGNGEQLRSQSRSPPARP